MGRIVVAALWLLLAASPARAADDIVPQVTLRDSGYLLGDLLDEHVELTLPKGFSIDVGSLPAPGRVAPWLEVRDAALDPRRSDGTQALRVTYQIFAEVEEPTRVPLPEFKLRVDGPAGGRTVIVPPQSFLLSPALPVNLGDKDRVLRIAPPPQPINAKGHVATAVASLIGALACVVYLLWRYDRLPFLPRAPGPIARAWRRWRRRRTHVLSEADQQALLRDVHAALSASAGETLYPSTLPRLFDRAPHLAPLREDIERFFAASWERFYDPGAATRPPPDGVLALLHVAADRERGVPC